MTTVDQAALEAAVRKALRQTGSANVSMRRLRTDVEAAMGIDLSLHKEQLATLVNRLLREPPSTGTLTDDHRIQFLMEKLLDEQEEKTRLTQRVADLESRLQDVLTVAPTGYQYKPVGNSIVSAGKTVTELQRTRDRLVDEYLEIDEALNLRRLQDCGRALSLASTSVAHNGTASEILEAKKREHEAIVSASIRRIRSEAIRIENVAEVEDLLRISKKAAGDAVLFSTAYSQIRPFIIDENRTPNGSAEEATVLRSLREMVAAFGMHSKAIIGMQRDLIDNVVLREREIIKLCRRCINRTTLSRVLQDVTHVDLRSDLDVTIQRQSKQRSSKSPRLDSTKRSASASVNDRASRSDSAGSLAAVRQPPSQSAVRIPSSKSSSTAAVVVTAESLVPAVVPVAETPRSRAIEDDEWNDFTQGVDRLRLSEEKRSRRVKFDEH